MKNKQFFITDEMRNYVKENEKEFSSQYLDDMRYAWIDFCSKFNTQWNFDMRWNPDWDMYLLYVCNVKWLEIIVDWDIRFDNWDEFLDYIDDMENYIIDLQENLSLNN